MDHMYKKVSFMGVLNERTGYGIHASRFVEQLSRIIPVEVNRGNLKEDGVVYISMLDTCSIQNVHDRLPYPSIVYNAWESTEQPEWFLDRLKFFDYLWVPSEWQRSASIAQGIPEEFVFVVPEGVDPEIYKPEEYGGIDPKCAGLAVKQILDREIPKGTFNFLHVGQFQRRKSTKEICEAFLKAFPENPDVRLYLSVDTLFPSDPYKTTEERMAAHGFSDSRFCIVHFEERTDYIRRLQNAHVFLSCARAEGWNLPLVEAIASGVPSIAADYSGSTEYARDILLVRVPKLEKPKEIYGNWEVPGMWGSPDYDHLVEVMRDAYENYSTHKKKALIISDEIRTKFSWEAAAKKAYDLIQEIPRAPGNVPIENKVEVAVPALVSQVATPSPEIQVKEFARQHGFEILSMERKRIIFTMDTHPDTPEKLQCLRESIKQVKDLGYPLLLTSHYPLPADVVESVDFHIYDKRDIMSGDDKPIYWRILPDGTKETTKSGIPCHAVASTMNVRNGIDFCLGKYDWIYHMSSDCEVDLAEWLKLVQASKKPLIGSRWDGQENTFGGQMIAGRIDVMDKLLGRYETWEEFKAEFGDQRFNSEEGMLRRATEAAGEEGFDIIDIQLGNRFDQVDRNAWKDDVFQFHFVDGPFLQIVGNANRQYDVNFIDEDDVSHGYWLKQATGTWSRPNTKYMCRWKITAELNGETKFSHTFDLTGKAVLISMASKALGDTLAWVPYVEAFREKHKCTIYLSTWWNNILNYPEIHMIKPGDVVDEVYATFEVGCFDNQPDKNPQDWRTVPLQRVAADILGVDYEPIPAKLKYDPVRTTAKPYVCFSEFSTMQNKFWNRPGAWQQVIDYLNSIGFECVCISAEQTGLKNVIDHCGQSIEQTIQDVAGAKFYVGLNAGPTWIAYSLGIPVVMITGVSEPFNNPPNPYRIQVDACRPGCFNDPSIPIERGWDWCPRKRDYACTREITSTMVIEMINKLISDHSGKEDRHASKTQKISKREGSGQHSAWNKSKSNHIGKSESPRAIA